MIEAEPIRIKSSNSIQESPETVAARAENIYNEHRKISAKLAKLDVKQPGIQERANRLRTRADRTGSLMWHTAAELQEHKANKLAGSVESQQGEYYRDLGEASVLALLHGDILKEQARQEMESQQGSHNDAGERA